MTTVCGWAVTTCGCGGCWQRHTQETRDRAATLATHFLWSATGRRYGVCRVTVMPCNPPPAPPLYVTYPVTGASGYDPMGGPDSRIRIAGGQVHNVGCGRSCEVPLDGPVQSIVEVVVAGEVVPAGSYEVHNGRLLVRTDGECWPACPGYDPVITGFEVTYMRGVPVPDAVQHAVEMLACQYAAACAEGGGGGDCSLPTELTSITRDGMHLTLEAADKVATRRLRTGISAVDDVIDADNPYGLVEAPRVLSPDMPPAGRVVTWAGGS